MTDNTKLEAYIPYRRSDIIELCLKDGKLSREDTQTFKEFCQILSAFYHFRFHKTLEIIKENYAVFNPNADVEPLEEPNLDQYNQMQSKVVEAFNHILERANYIRLSKSIVDKALGQKSLINLQTHVDFNDFEQFLCYYRGDTTTTTKVKKFFFWEEEKTIEIFERVVLLIKFKGKGYFSRKESNPKALEELKFTPGKMYVYFYKNIPKFDLDLLFPNIKTSMTWKDRLLFGVPAVGAAIPLILRTLPNILLLIAAILLVFNARDLIQSLNVEQDKLQDIMPVLVATLSLGMALGGFAFKQYNNYKSKKIQFQKDVTDTLFFKNLANNDSVFQRLIDIAEEEECKEIILVYYHLLTSQNPLNPEQLDAKIENWMQEKLGIGINFDIHGPLNNLQEIKGKIEDNSNQPEVPLLSYDQQGYCHVIPLKQARTVIDWVWDNAFQYNGKAL
ncbi:TMEM143 family protein [Capilliphycus salinus ALCB114379]|uniref:TMEM143 family protein n=1 Tax=Capilliphycus salinus TaxID=2768948 RepID=UPI0039A7802D